MPTTEFQELRDAMAKALANSSENFTARIAILHDSSTNTAKFGEYSAIEAIEEFQTFPKPRHPAHAGEGR